MLRGLSAGQVAVLERLDGSRSRTQLHRVAAEHGDPPQVVDELLALLRRTGALADPGAERVAYVTRGRDLQRLVLVGGPPSLSGRVTQALEAAGLHGVALGDTARDQLRAALQAPEIGAWDTPAPELVILCAHDAIDPPEAAAWSRGGIPHLAFVTEGDRVVVGPLVEPLRRGGGVCLNCLELHRCDRDAGRASVLAQATRPSRPGRRADTETLTALVGPGGPVQPTPLESALLAAGAAVAALTVAAYLIGDRLPEGVTVELSGACPRLDHRVWPRHPQCLHH